MINIRKKGSAWVGIIILLIFIITLGLALVTDSVTTIVQSKRLAQVQVAQALCDAGVERAIWELNKNSNYAGQNNLSLSTGVFDIEVTNSGSLDTKEVLVTAYVPNKENSKRVERSIRAKLIAEPRESNVAFNYAVQVGSLGVTMSNNAVLNGNLYSAGDLKCAINALISGDAYLSSDVSGNATMIDRCKISGNSKAHDATRSTIDGWLRYVGSMNSTTAAQGATQLTNKTELDDEVPYINLPISQLTIENWQSWASDGGIYAGNYVLNTGQIAELGPKVIEGNLTISSNSELTLTGAVWVKGNIYINSNSALKLHPSFESNGGILIADNPNNRSDSGFIRVESGVDVFGSDPNEFPESYILMLSTNTKSLTSDPAIRAGNNSDAVVYYATTGMIEVSQNAKLRAVSGGGLNLSNGAILDYSTGLASANFSGGPGGGWKLKEWQVIY